MPDVVGYVDVSKIWQSDASGQPQGQGLEKLRPRLLQIGNGVSVLSAQAYNYRPCPTAKYKQQWIVSHDKAHCVIWLSDLGDSNNVVSGRSVPTKM